MDKCCEIKKQKVVHAFTVLMLVLLLQYGGNSNTPTDANVDTATDANGDNFNNTIYKMYLRSAFGIPFLYFIIEVPL